MCWMASSAIAVVRFQLGIALERIDRRRVAEQVRLPLARVAADKAIEILEAHSVRPLIERPGLARLVRRRVVVLAEPRGRVAVLLQDCADGALVDRDDRVVTRKTRRYFADHPVAHRVMVASRDDRRPRRRAERGGVEIGVAQPLRGDSVERRCRDHPAKCARRAEAGIVGHDEQHIGRALRRHDARSPPGVDSEAFSLITPPKFGSGGGSCFPSIVVVAPGEPGTPVTC